MKINVLSGIMLIFLKKLLRRRKEMKTKYSADLGTKGMKYLNVSFEIILKFDVT